MRTPDTQERQTVVNVVQALAENSLFLALCAYFLCRHIKVPTDIDPHFFYPFHSILGFHKGPEGNYFSVTIAFAFLAVRFSNALGKVLVRE